MVFPLPSDVSKAKELCKLILYSSTCSFSLNIPKLIVALKDLDANLRASILHKDKLALCLFLCCATCTEVQRYLVCLVFCWDAPGVQNIFVITSTNDSAPHHCWFIKHPVQDQPEQGHCRAVGNWYSSAAPSTGQGCVKVWPKQKGQDYTLEKENPKVFPLS